MAEFPKGWGVEDREDTSILYVETILPIPGRSAICLRPRLMENDEWRKIAVQIANGLDRIWREDRLTTKEQS